MERNVFDFIETHTEAVAPVELRLAAARWDEILAVDSEAPARARALERELATFYADRQSYGRIIAYDREVEGLKPATSRLVRVLKLRFARHQFAPESIERMAVIEAALQRDLRTLRIDDGREKLSLREVGKLLETSSDLKRRQDAWLGLRRAGTEIGAEILRLSGLRNRLARDHDFADWFRLALEVDDLDAAQVHDLVRALLVETEPLYVELKEALELDIGERFGLAAGTLRPWHHADPFLRRVPPGKAPDIDRWYADKDPVVLAQLFLGGLGLDVSEILARAELKRGPLGSGPEGVVDRARDGRDLRLAATIEASEAGMHRLVSWLARALYHAHVAPGLHFMLRDPSHEVVAGAVTELLASLTRSEGFLSQILGAHRPAAVRTAARAAELRRIETLLRLRHDALVFLFQRAMYQDPGSDLDRVYWDLVARIHHVERPDELKGRHHWAVMPDVTASPAELARRLLVPVGLAQLRDRIGQRIEGGVWIGAKEVGRFLIEEIFGKGAMLRWQEVVLPEGPAQAAAVLRRALSLPST